MNEEERGKKGGSFRDELEGVDGEIDGVIGETRERLSGRAVAVPPGESDTDENGDLYEYEDEFLSELGVKASSTAPKKPDATYEGDAWKYHMDNFKEFQKSEPDEDPVHNPHTERAFNSDARNLREWEGWLERGLAPISRDGINARTGKAMVLDTYRKLGYHAGGPGGSIARNYPRSQSGTYWKQIVKMQQAFRLGHQQRAQEQGFDELNGDMVKEIEEMTRRALKARRRPPEHRR